MRPPHSWLLWPRMDRESGSVWCWGRGFLEAPQGAPSAPSIPPSLFQLMPLCSFSPTGLSFLEGLPGPLAGERPSPKSHGQRAPEAPLRGQSRGPLLHRAPDAAEPDEMNQPDSFVKREQGGQRAIIPSQSHQAVETCAQGGGFGTPTKPCFLGGSPPQLV